MIKRKQLEPIRLFGDRSGVRALSDWRLGMVGTMALLIATVSALSAQDARFRSFSRLVVLPTVVTDAEGRSVNGLTSRDFAVIDRGNPRSATVDTIDTAYAPVSLVIAVQSSGISAAVLEKVRKVGGMLLPLVAGEGGCAGLLSFAGSLEWLQDCTTDEDALKRALDRLRPGEPKQARLLDGVSSAIQHLAKLPNARRVLLVISERRDRGSESRIEAVVADAVAAGVTVYAATYSPFKTAFTSKEAPVSTKRKRDAGPGENNPMRTFDGGAPTKANPGMTPDADKVDLEDAIGESIRLWKVDTTSVLTRETSGRTFPFVRERGLEASLQALGMELHSEYLLSLVPDISVSGFHNLEVRVLRQGDFHVRVRSGYWAE